MKNPFRPSEIVSEPGEFYGRSREIRELARLLRQGSIAIQGQHRDYLSNAYVGHTERGFVLIYTGLYTLQEGRHLAALSKILEDQAFRKFINKGGYFIIAVDEAEKCAPAIARLFRHVATKSQLNGVNNIRFVFAGVSPFVERMVTEDQGVIRFVYETIELKPFELEKAREFLDDKFAQVLSSAEESGADLHIDPTVIDRIVQLSGGHPHLLQLLGSHVIEHEFSNADGVMDNEDLVGSLQKIC